MTTATKTSVTPEELLNLPDAVNYELVGGRLVERHLGSESSAIGAGVRLIWVVNPRTRTVRVHRASSSQHGPISFLTESDMISGEDVLDGFECPVADFFQS